MTSTLFREWRMFEELDPFSIDRNDVSLARIVQYLARDGRPLREFMFPFGDLPNVWVSAPKQTVEQQERLIDTWIAGNNMALQAKGRNS